MPSLQLVLHRLGLLFGVEKVALVGLALGLLVCLRPYTCLRYPTTLVLPGLYALYAIVALGLFSGLLHAQGVTSILGVSGLSDSPTPGMLLFVLPSLLCARWQLVGTPSIEGWQRGLSVINPLQDSGTDVALFAGVFGLEATIPALVYLCRVGGGAFFQLAWPHLTPLTYNASTNGRLSLDFTN